MYLPFSSLPGHARLWIYQANRQLTEAEVTRATARLREFCEGWQAHGTPLQTSFEILYRYFIVLAVDEAASGVSGCSIDGSVRMMKSMQEDGLDFFDRKQVAFLQEGDPIRSYPLSDLKSLFGTGTLSPTTVTFNNLVQTKSEWQRQWRIPVRDSWIAGYLPKTEVAK